MYPSRVLLHAHACIVVLQSRVCPQRKALWDQIYRCCPVFSLTLSFLYKLPLQTFTFNLWTMKYLSFIYYTFAYCVIGPILVHIVSYIICNGIKRKDKPWWFWFMIYQRIFVVSQAIVFLNSSRLWIPRIYSDIISTFIYSWLISAERRHVHCY